MLTIISTVLSSTKHSGIKTESLCTATTPQRSAIIGCGLLAVRRTAAPLGDYKKNTYVYAYIYTGTQHYYRIMFKTEKYTPELMDEVYKVLYSFSEDVPIRGTSDVYTDFKPDIPQNWTDETKKVY